MAQVQSRPIPSAHNPGTPKPAPAPKADKPKKEKTTKVAMSPIARMVKSVELWRSHISSVAEKLTVWAKRETDTDRGAALVASIAALTTGSDALLDGRSRLAALSAKHYSPPKGSAPARPLTAGDRVVIKPKALESYADIFKKTELKELVAVTVTEKMVQVRPSNATGPTIVVPRRFVSLVPAEKAAA